MRAAIIDVTAAGSKWANNLVAAGREPGFRHLAFDTTRSASQSPATTTRSNRGFRHLRFQRRLNKRLNRRARRGVDLRRDGAGRSVGLGARIV